MGTRLRIVAEAEDRRAALLATESALGELERYEGLLSSWTEGSEISRLNSSPPGNVVVVKEPLASLLEEARAWAVRSDRHFDPTVGALIDAWDLRGDGRVPTDSALTHALARTGGGAFSFSAGGRRVRRIQEGAWIDAGGFGKGAALRAAADELRTRPLERALVDLGGQLWAWSEEEEPWSVAVAHPAERGEAVATLAVHDVSVATSGSSERWVDVGGERLGHILDPRTGRPVSAWGSVTVVSPDPVEADVLATALYVMGPERGMRWALDHTEAGVLFARLGDHRVDLTWNPAMEAWLVERPGAGR